MVLFWVARCQRMENNFIFRIFPRTKFQKSNSTFWTYCINYPIIQQALTWCILTVRGAYFSNFELEGTSKHNSGISFEHWDTFYFFQKSCSPSLVLIMAKTEYFAPDTQSTFLLPKFAYKRKARQTRDFRKSCRTLFAKIGSDTVIFSFPSVGWVQKVSFWVARCQRMEKNFIFWIFPRTKVQKSNSTFWTYCVNYPINQQTSWPQNPKK